MRTYGWFSVAGPVLACIVLGLALWLFLRFVAKKMR